MFLSGLWQEEEILSHFFLNVWIGFRPLQAETPVLKYFHTPTHANIHSKTRTGTDLMLKTTPLCTSFLQQVFNTTLWEDSASFCHFLKEFAVRIMHRQLSAPPTEGFSFTLHQWHFGRVKWTETLSINLIFCVLTGGKYFGGWSWE